MNLACKEKSSKTVLPSVLLQVFLEKGGKPLRIRVKPREVSTNMVLLEVDNPWFSRDPATIQGKKAVLHLLDPEGQGAVDISGTIIIAINQPGRVKLGMQYAAKPDKEVRKILEGLLTDVPGDVKKFWELWDDNHEPRKSFLDNFRGVNVGKIFRSFMNKRECPLSESET